MKNCTITALFISFLLFSYSCQAQKSKDKQLAKSLDSLLSKQFNPNGPGISLLVAKKGKIIYEKAFGSASLELSVPIRPEMVFNLGSITKQFTAVAILQLVEKGKISLQDSLQKYVPDFPSKGYPITIENLLTHTSGIKDYMQIDYPEPYMERRDFSPKVLIDSFKSLPLEFEPGTKFHYSNSGYFLLGFIIERVTAKTWQDYLQENIFTPLGLTNTYTDHPNAIIKNRVYGYKKEDQHFEKADYWSATISYAAGGLLSSVEDLYKWQKGLYAYQILRKETLDKAFTNFKLKNGTTTGYGYGWFLKDISGIKSIEHGGAITGFLTNEIYYPAEDIYVVSLFNCDCAPKDALSATIAGLALGKPLQPDVKITDAILNNYTGTYTLSIDTSRTIIIFRENNQLIAKVSGQGSYPLLFQSDTKFEFKNILDASCEFIRENNKVIKFIISQNGQYEWNKIK